MSAGLVALIRRALVAVLTGMAVAAAIRLRARQRAVPPQTGGWRELSDAELASESAAGELPAACSGTDIVVTEPAAEPTAS